MELQIGVRGHDLKNKTTIEEFTKAVHDYGFNKVQLVFNKAFNDFSYSDEYVNKVKQELNKYKITVSMLGAYFNPVHSNKETVQKGIFNFKENLRISHVFSNALVGSETGSYNDSPWTYVPKNHTEEGYLETLSVFKELVRYAEEINSTIAVEPAFNHVIYSVDVLQRFINDLNSKNVYVTIDLYNLLSLENYKAHKEIFHQALSTFKDNIKIIHLKDFKVENNQIIQVSPFKGYFDYPYMIKEIKKYAPNAVLTFEGVTSEYIKDALTALKTCIQDN